jgi:hypothetical protein
VALFSIAAGLLYGAWVDGARIAPIALGLSGFVALLAIALAALHARRLRSTPPTGKHA